MFKRIRVIAVTLGLISALLGCGPSQQDAEMLGFANVNQMKEIQAMGYKSYKEAKRESQNLGFESPEEMMLLKNKGFKTRRDYVASNLGSPLLYVEACGPISKRVNDEKDLAQRQKLEKVYVDSCLGHEIKWNAIVKFFSETHKTFILVARENFNNDESIIAIGEPSIEDSLGISFESDGTVEKCVFQGVAINQKNAGGQMINFSGKIAGIKHFPDFTSKARKTGSNKIKIIEISTCDIDPKSGPLVAKLAEDRKIWRIERKKKEQEESRQGGSDQWGYKCSSYEATRKQCASSANFSQCMNITSGSNEWQALKDICPSR